MSEIRIVFAGPSPSSAERTHQNLVQWARTRGLPFTQFHFPTVKRTDARRIVRGSDPKDSNAEWLPMRFDREDLVALLETGAKTIHGRLVRVEVQEGTDATGLLTEIEFPDPISVRVDVFQKSKTARSKNAPFSYDPELDYRTEPK